MAQHGSATPVILNRPESRRRNPVVKPLTSLVVRPGQTKSGTEHPQPREVVRKFSRLEPDSNGAGAAVDDRL